MKKHTEADGQIPSTSASARKGQVCIPLSNSDEASNEQKKPDNKMTFKKAVVVIPDLRDVLLMQATEVTMKLPAKNARKRIPFRGVNPAPDGDKPETVKRRNAVRLCKTGSASPPDLEAPVRKSAKRSFNHRHTSNSGNFRPRALRRRREHSRASRDESVESTPKAVAFCKHCNKVFNVLEFALEHEVFCSKNPVVILQQTGDVRDNAEEKVNFLSTLQLKPASAPEIDNGQSNSSGTAIVGPQDARGGRIQRAKVLKQFRTYPIPLASARGQKIIAESGMVWHDHNSIPPVMLDDQCSSIKTRPRTTSRTTFTRYKKQQDDDYVHQASFSKQQRVLRNSELVIGLSHKSWKNFNKCKEASLHVVRLSKTEIAKYVKRPRVVGSKIKCRELTVQVDDLTKKRWFRQLFPLFNKNKKSK